MEQQVTLSNINSDELINLCKKNLQNSEDLLFHKMVFKDNKKLVIIYYNPMVNTSDLNQFVLTPLLEYEDKLLPNIKQLKEHLPLINTVMESDISNITKELIAGHAIVFIEQEDSLLYIDVSKRAERGLDKAETESLVFGPKISFTESLSTNITIIRQIIVRDDLCIDNERVGKKNETELRLVYIKELVDSETVDILKEKIRSLEVDDVFETSILAQLIEDNSYSIFPQFIQTELPDRVTYNLNRGMIAIFVDRSPMVLTGPASLFSFFESTEDLYMRWNMGSFIRILRYMTMFLSVLLTPAYVATITYHYEMIPSALLVSLGESRSKVPFSPIFEAFLLEIMIELLREAGARLPTKVGQTMGIVGGIVLGTAAVEAGFTSNILIIVVALSALGSFTAPSYLMGTAIRVIRFPILILAGLWGGIGITVGLAFILLHLIRLTSVGMPYLLPAYPLKISGLANTIVRLPRHLLSKNPSKKSIFTIKSIKENYSKDIDE
ncbi:MULTISPECIES: spore germination protein [Bacillus]|uniref:spore germination protein n=1 Tax=Bacillus TaxID=1386 RepID=UPI000BB6DF2E|nr:MULTISPECIES: spore germination protein [Bacillus]